MSDSCPTVKKKDDNSVDGFVIINAEDFDPETMELYDESPSEPELDKPAKPKAKRKP